MADRDQNPEGAESRSEWQDALLYVRENPPKVAGGAGFLLLCIAIGGLFSMKNTVEDRKSATEYAAALTTEDPGLRASALEATAGTKSRWSVEALYLLGETAIEAKTYDKAREAFEKVLKDHSDSEYAPMAADGLAFLHENEGNLEEALKGYTHVFETWEDTVTGRRQPFNIARVQEGLGNHAEAIKGYEQQTEIFPGSTVARKSEMALDRLKREMPELFPEEAPVETLSIDAAPAEAAPAEAAPAEAAPVEEAPVEEAPVEEAPVEEAPAEEAPAE